MLLVTLLLLQITFIFILFFLPPIDTDLGWHLRYGEYILNNGGVLRQNLFTYFLPDYTWTYSYFLYQVFIAGIFKLTGLYGLSVVNGVVMVISFLFFRKLYPKIPATIFLAFLITTFFGWNVFYLGIRPQIFTFLGLIISFWLLLKTEKNHKYLLFFPFLLMIWANVHGSFILGLVLIGFATIQEIASKKWRVVPFLIATLVVSVLSALVNPFTWHVYEWSLVHLQYPLKELIAEWVPPSWVLQIVIITITIFATWLVYAFRPRNWIFLSLTIFFFAFLGVSARRNLPLFSLAATVVYLQLLEFKLMKDPKTKAVTLKTIVGGISFVGILFLAIFFRSQTLKLSSDFNSYCNQGLVPYPCRAVEFIKSRPQEGSNVFTAYEWGGFLEWQLPQYKYFVDGRMPTWPTKEGKSPYTIYLEIIQAKPGYDEKLESYNTDWLLIGSGTYLDIELRKRKDSKWREIYRDETAVIFSSLSPST